MTALQFTPGPWEVSTLTPVGVTTADAGDGMVRNIVIAHEQQSGLASKDEERKANARLIATAPELYALGELALQHMEQSLAGLLESHCLLDDKLQPIRETLEADVRDDVERLESDIAATRALLAKARGEK